MKILRAGFWYAAMVFAAGFVLGVLRTLWLAPRLGETKAVAIELPFMLAISWAAAGLVVRRLVFPSRFWPRAKMGAVAFALLIGFEVALGVGAAGLSPQAFLAKFATPSGALGLFGQIAFAAFPLVQARR